MLQWIREAIRELLSGMPDIIKALPEENYPAQVTKQVIYCYQDDCCLEIDKQQGKRKNIVEEPKPVIVPILSAVSAEIKNIVCSCSSWISYISSIYKYYCK